jgi:hypothetical protein
MDEVPPSPVGGFGERVRLTARPVDIHLRGTRLRSRLAVLLAGLTVLALAAALTLLGLNADRFHAAQLGFEVVFAAAILLYTGTGRLITARVPGNAIGWLLGLIGLLLAGEMLAEQYAVYGLLTVPGSLPAVKVTGWFSVLFAVLAAFTLLFLLLLFPDGRLPSPRWRSAQFAIGVVLVVAVASQMQAGQLISGGLTDVLDNGHAAYPNPLGIFPRNGWFGGFVALVIVLAVTAGLTAVASVFARRRGASVERRKQLAWLGYVGVLTLSWITVLLLGEVFGGGAAPWIGNVLWILSVLTPAAGIPVACVVAVLKYRLYDIDRLISRTLAYAIVTGLLVGVYAGLVILATRVLPLHTPVAVAGSTLVAAALFSPLRRRVQVKVDRRFNRARYDADQMVAAFAGRLKDTADLDSVRDDLTRTVYQALEPTLMSVWVNERW